LSRDIGYWILDIGYWVLGIGYCILDIRNSALTFKKKASEKRLFIINLRKVTFPHSG
jgi:hypothetical protein